MDRWNRSRPNPPPLENYNPHLIRSRDHQSSENWDRESLNSRDKFTAEYWELQSNYPRDATQPGYMGQYSISSRNPLPSGYLNQYSINSSDGFSAEYYQQSSECRDKWSPGYLSEHSINSSDGFSAEYYQQSSECRDKWSTGSLNQHSVNSSDKFSAEYNQQSSECRDKWSPGYLSQHSVNSSDGFSAENYQQSNECRDLSSLGYLNQHSINSRDRFSPHYLDQQSRNKWPLLPTPTLSRDGWSPDWDQQPTYLGDPGDQHPITYKNSSSQECYTQSFETIQRHGYYQESHESKFQYSSFRSDLAYHPYLRPNQKSRYRRRRYTAGNRANLLAPVPYSVSNAAQRIASKKQKKFVQVASKKPKKGLQVASEKQKNSLQTIQVGNKVTTLEEVLYLFSVDSDEGRLVELVDLSENSQISENQGLLASASTSSHMPWNSNKEACATLNEPSSDDKNKTSLNSGKSDTQNTTQSKEYGGAYCNMCNKSYEELLNNKSDLYIAKCGHLFCALCIPYLKTKSTCFKCKTAITNLRKIFM